MKIYILLLMIVLVGIFYRNKREDFSNIDNCRTMRYYGSHPGGQEYYEVDPMYSEKEREVRQLLWTKTG